MKLFNCSVCNQLIFFENIQCVHCGHALGYLSDVDLLSALDPAGENLWRALAAKAGQANYKMCLNYRDQQVCNWVLPAENPADLCPACNLNQTIPDLSNPQNHLYWQRLEIAKRRLVYGLRALGLPLQNKQEDPEHGLAFAFLADPDGEFKESNRVMTGHAEGLITINLAEADDAVRERRRLDMNERYRTLLGHLRHESGHYYWERLVNPSDLLEPFREIFGDERTDYDIALQHHYDNGPPAGWELSFVSTYASSHPWEDWAESWAHYLHIVDTLETTRQFSLRVTTPVAGTSTATPDGVASYCPLSSEAMIASWLPLTYAINSINRSMGQPDMYPFVLSELAIKKLAFVHQVITSNVRLKEPGADVSS
ncbi:MAG: zinc-binding metallopeptidase family protein [Porticoccaceae bacterium]